MPPVNFYNFSFAQAFSIGAWRGEKDRLKKKLERFTLQHAQPILATFQHAPETLPVVETAVYEGFPVKVVCSLSEMENTELVIMGGMGAGKEDQPAGLFGSVAIGMGLYSRSPVIMLPPNYGYPAVGSLAIAFGRLKDIKQLEGITKRIISVLQPKVSFLQVDESGKEEGKAFTEEFINLALSPGF